MTFIEFVICLALIGVSAFLSGAEIALFSLTKFQIRSLRDRARGPYRYVKKLLADPGGVLGTILITNEVANIGISALTGRAIGRNPYLAQLAELIPPVVPRWILDTAVGILITTPIILLLCDVTPKTLGARANYVIAPLTVKPLHLLYGLFAPVRALLNRVLRIFNAAPPASLPAPTGDTEALVKQNEFLLLLEEGQKEGTIQESEVSLIKNLFELDRTTVDAISTPIAQSQCLLAKTTIGNALSAMRGAMNSRIPVLSQDRKQVLGVLYAKDLIEIRFNGELLGQPITTLMRKPLLVPANTKLSTLFRKMTQQKNHIALVLGPNGDSKSIVTMTDIFDELFEDVLPDSDDDAEEN